MPNHDRFECQTAIDSDAILHQSSDIPFGMDINDACMLQVYRIAQAALQAKPSDGLVRAVRFYELVKRENPPVETGAWQDAVDWVLKEACQVVNTGIKGD
ncbi:hypothetical protein [Escherichia coli]|uniref:hypothetical protein n=1 Tax=Escherichia coli TaxID=562 RepID=UPI003787076C